jgi:hypothetical protein
MINTVTNAMTVIRSAPPTPPPPSRQPCSVAGAC